MMSFTQKVSLRKMLPMSLLDLGKFQGISKSDVFVFVEDCTNASRNVREMTVPSNVDRRWGIT